MPRYRDRDETRDCLEANKFTDFFALAACLNSLLFVHSFSFLFDAFLRVVVTKRKIEDTTQIKLDRSEHMRESTDTADKYLWAKRRQLKEEKIISMRWFLFFFFFIYADVGMDRHEMLRNYKLFANTEQTRSGIERRLDLEKYGKSRVILIQSLRIRLNIQFDFVWKTFKKIFFSFRRSILCDKFYDFFHTRSSLEASEFVTLTIFNAF